MTTTWLGRPGPSSQQCEPVVHPVVFGRPHRSGPHPAGSALDVFRQFRDQAWIVNSRSHADEEVVRTLASMAGFVPRLSHRVDSLDLVEELVAAGLGVGLLPSGFGGAHGLTLLSLTDPDVKLRAYAHARTADPSGPPGIGARLVASAEPAAIVPAVNRVEDVEGSERPGWSQALTDRLHGLLADASWSVMAIGVLGLIGW